MDSTESVHFPPQTLNHQAMNNTPFPHTESTQEIFDKGAIKNKPRRKKAARACLHCQKSHLTCSDERPCKRCVIRGLENECCDGQRKKAKYLIEPEDTSHSKEIQTENMISLNQQTFMPTAVSLEAFQNSLPMLPPNYDTSQAFLMDPIQEYGFFSETANLEHDMLINMASQFMMPELGSYQGFPAFPLAETWTPLNPAPPPLSVTSLPHSAEKQQYSLQNQTLNQVSPLLGKKDLSALRSPEQVSLAYSEVKSAFCYSTGYHYLLKYIQERMSKENVLRICRAISQFRPSFIALFMNLTEEDLIFIEKCFQRTLLEFEKLISLSGTPTVVWRKTGEIVLVGKEFSILTSWPPSALLEKTTFIYELMDDISAVEYWEKFAVHAFDNSEMSVMSTCNIYGANRQLVPCAFCFTIKRDIFDTPLLIVGNFLPILT